MVKEWRSKQKRDRNLRQESQSVTFVGYVVTVHATTSYLIDRRKIAGVSRVQGSLSVFT